MNVKKRLVKLVARLVDWKIRSENKWRKDLQYDEVFPVCVSLRRSSVIRNCELRRKRLRNRGIELTIMLYGTEYSVNMDGTGHSDGSIEWWSSPAYDRHDD